MKHNPVATICSLFLTLTMSQADHLPNLAEFQKMPPRTATVANLMTNGSFDDGPYEKPASGSRAEIARYHGVQYSTGLKMVPDITRRVWVYSLTIPNKPQNGKIYKVSAACRREGTLKHAAICVEAYKNGKYAYGHYRFGTDGKNTKDWHRISGLFKTKGEKTDDYTYVISCIAHTTDPKAQGAAYFDDFRVEEDAPQWKIANSFPLRNAISAHRGFIRFHTKFIGDYLPPDAEETYLVQLLRNGRPIAAKLAKREHECLEVTFGKLSPGPAVARVTLLDIKHREIMDARDMTVTVTPPYVPPVNGWDMDEHGRCILNGKTFMPMGFYTGFSAKPEDRTKVLTELKRIQKTGLFNFIVDYGQYLHSSKERRCAWIRECYNHGLWSSVDICGYSFKPMTTKDRQKLKERVKAYAKEPGTFCYYLSDEPPESRVPAMAQVRKIANDLDPAHPTWIVNVYGHQVDGFFPAADLIVYDSYPLRPGGTLQSTDLIGQTYKRNKLPHWGVSQCFNLNNYQGAKSNLTLEAYQAAEPTENQILANALTMAIHGAKAFIFYSYMDLQRGYQGKQADEATFLKRWKATCNAAAIIKNLEPFIMSGLPPVTIIVENARGKVSATCLTDGNGRHRLMAVGIDQDNEAIITLPAGTQTLTPCYGYLKALGGNRYRFTGKGITADVAR